MYYSMDISAGGDKSLSKREGFFKKEGDRKPSAVGALLIPHDEHRHIFVMMDHAVGDAAQNGGRKGASAA